MGETETERVGETETEREGETTKERERENDNRVDDDDIPASHSCMLTDKAVLID